MRFEDVSSVEIQIVDDHECYLVTVPGASKAEGLEFLHMVGSGMAGSGIRMTQLGYRIPQIRMEYERQLRTLALQREGMEARFRAGELTKEEFARWLHGERRRIAYSGRWQQGLGAVTVLEARDWAKYGVGGRSWENMTRHASRGLPPSADPLDRLIGSASRSNTGVSEAAIRGARMLRSGGPIFLIVGVGVSAHEIASAPAEERPHVAGQVAAEAGGGFLGSGLGVGVCIAFGVATSGWGLIGCGLVGGAAGGYAGGTAYRSLNPPETMRQIERDGQIDTQRVRLVPYH
ncbi:hypothetical protein [Parazoarcus communis]|uniref:Uncharacterized protein n=1 Tax=Parazoarcus communis SWub3 = DSM 12120 TaxID=1121029 RepID=A0A323UP53_9RHOO|nr:hypothetical protein [Parazoarcus communis]NMG72902.1 hypothetical protein [Parazoarcus communis SWub3 = DSM 12120]PZA14274.1 hypothetical protein DNK49_22740 [Azoarcus communis] [Parazoarcus communis SWub3 = DSM 12120]